MDKKTEQLCESVGEILGKSGVWLVKILLIAYIAMHVLQYAFWVDPYPQEYPAEQPQQQEFKV